MTALDEIRSYIAERSGEAVADRAAERIFGRPEQIGESIKDEWVEVLTVPHGARGLVE